MEKRFSMTDQCPFCTKINQADATECECGATKNQERIGMGDAVKEDIANALSPKISKKVIIGFAALLLITWLFNWWGVFSALVIILVIAVPFLLLMKLISKIGMHKVANKVSTTQGHEWYR